MAGAQEVFNGPVTQTYASTASNALGAPGGTKRIETADGREYRLVQAGATVADGALVRLDSVSGSTGTIVEQFAAAQSHSPVFGAMQAGQSVAAAGYFWAMVKGTASIRSADIGSDESMISAINIALNTDARIASVRTAAATTTAGIIMPKIGQFIESVSRASDATVTGAFYIVGMGA